jgi:hypothetical protein
MLLVIGLVQNLLCLGRIWGKAFSSLVGLLSHTMMFRRESYCMLDIVYVELQRLSPTGANVSRISSAALDELAVSAVLLPLIGSSLRAQVSPNIVCSDASGGQRPRAGITESAVSQIVADNLWRHRLRKGGCVRMLPDTSDGFWRDDLQGRVVDTPEAYLADIDASPELGERFFGDISDAMSWKTVFGYNLKENEHINFHEHHAVCLAVLAEMRRGGGDVRKLIGCDSDCICAIFAKGRSSSRRLNKRHRRICMHLLFAGVYVGMLRTPTSQNTSDAPSRRRPTRVGPIPNPREWARRYIAGELHMLDAYVDSDSRGQWFLDYAHEHFTEVGLRPGDDNKIGDGPRPAAARRTEINLLAPLVGDKEVVKRSKIFDEFVIHARAEGIDEDALWSGAGFMSQALRLFGQHLYMNGRSRGDYARLVNAIRDRRPEWGPNLRGAWDLDRKWQAEEPTRHRIPLPSGMFEAAFVIALLRGWLPFATALLIGYLGALRPGELLRLTRKAILLPQDLASNDSQIFVVIDKPKTRRKAATTQHVVLEHVGALKFLSWRLQSLAMHDLFFLCLLTFFLKLGSKCLLYCTPMYLLLAPFEPVLHQSCTRSPRI